MSTHRDRPLLVRYRMDEVERAVSRGDLARRPPNLWRYRELLPVERPESAVSLGEAITPLVATYELGRRIGLSNLWVKDESGLPTGSFKSRGMAVAVNAARERGIRRVALPTAGNAGSALAAYAAAADIDAYIFMPADAPLLNQHQCVEAGAHVFLVDGLITDCGAIVRDGRDEVGWFDTSTLREPFRLEGKKTMGLELAEQSFWKLPDVILYPTGGGTGLIGMWKAFAEMRALGWLESDARPRMVAVQSDGCCPIVNAFEKGERFCRFFQNANTIASGLRVPYTIGDFLILDAIHDSGGTAVAVPDHSVREWMRVGQELSGISFGPESACCIAAGQTLAETGWLAPDERVVVFNCGSERRSDSLSPLDLPVVKAGRPIDWEAIEGGRSS